MIPDRSADGRARPNRRSPRPQHFRRHRPGAVTRRLLTAAVPLAALAAGAVTTPTGPPVAAVAPGATAPTSPGMRTISSTRPADPAPPAAEAYGTASRLPGPSLSGDVVGAAVTGRGSGYWVVNAAGRVFAHGSAGHYGSLPPGVHAGRIVGIAPTASGHGYWLVSAGGGVFPFGDARFHGSLAGDHLHSPVVGIAGTADGAGYWLATASGGVFGFGGAAFAGSPNADGLRHHARIVGVAASRGQGYWLAAANGSVYEYGDATFHGSLPSRHRTAEVSAIAATPSGNGYWLAARTGGVYAFGDARFHGSGAPEPASTAVTALAATGPAGYLELTTAVRTTPIRTRAATAVAGVSLGDFVVTCYDLQGTTASGAPVSMSTVAVDPSVIPMGATIDISGVGVRVAQDTGGAIVGHRLDIWEPTYQDCVDWGVRTEHVTLLRR